MQLEIRLHYPTAGKIDMISYLPVSFEWNGSLEDEMVRVDVTRLRDANLQGDISITARLSSTFFITRGP